ncbi:MAG: translation initiation factor 2 [Oscillospiraceae bacterium]|nr:translation initiation factor 2 [Oscillospiraceae bacterium]
MVKGLSRKVVLVKFPELGVFEQAMFVVRDDAAAKQGVSADDVINEACRIAQNHSPRALRKGRSLPGLAYFLTGGASVGAAWILVALFG